MAPIFIELTGETLTNIFTAIILSEALQVIMLLSSNLKPSRSLGCKVSASFIVPSYVDASANGHEWKPYS